MISFVLLLSFQFCTAPNDNKYPTIPIASDEHGNLFFGDPFEQNIAAQIQSSIEEQQLTDEIPLSVELCHELHVEPPSVHISQPQTARTPLTDENIESLSADLYHPVHTLMRSVEVHKNIENSKTLHHEESPAATNTNTESIDTDLRTLLANRDSGPLSVDRRNTGPLLDEMMMEILNDTTQIRSAYTNMTCLRSSGPACEQSVTKFRTNPNQTFPQSGFSMNHFVKETGQKPSKCDMYQKQSLATSSRRTHQGKDTNKEIFQCDICSKQFSTSSSLQRHRLIHTDEKPYKCDICAKQFRTPADYQKHRRMHTGEKPFQCDFCQKQFSDSSNYRRHRRTHTGEKPYECETCSKQFTTSTNYQEHRRIHTGEKPYQCEVCPKQFRTSAEYTVHKRTHTGEKPFHCNICPKQFRTYSNLQDHRQTHTGEKSYICYWCNQGYYLKRGLINHVKKCSSRNVSYTADLDPVVSCSITSETRKMKWTYMQ